MLSHNEKLLRGVEDKISELHGEGKVILDRCKDENRERTAEEDQEFAAVSETLEGLRKDREHLKKQIEVDQSVLDSVRGNSNGDGIEVETSVEVVQSDPSAKSLGEQFIESKGYQALMENGMTGQEWSTGPVELKGTLGQTTTGPGTAFFQPDVQAGVVQTLYEPPTIASLMGQSNTSGALVRYITESTTVTNAAAGVLAGGAKPESTLDFVQVDEPVRKLATWLPVQDELLEDAPQLAGYINNRLSLFIRQVEDISVLRGAGSPDLQGIIGRSGVNTLGTAAAAGGTIPIEQIFKAANGLRGSSYLNPDTLVINPTNWGTIRLAKDTANQYYGGGPWVGPYGGPQGPVSANRFATGESFWNMNVVVTSAIGVGTALVGAFREAAAVVRRSGITVEATNSHSTFFANNITAIRAEERLALAVYRPAAFCTVTF